MTRPAHPPILTTTTRVHPLPDGELTLLGAHSSVTGAMTRIVMGNTKLLVDCGVAQGNEARDWEFSDAALDVDAVLLTHGHNDHVGSLPTLLERGYAGPLYGTPATLAIAEVVLEDGLRIQGHASQYVSRLVRDLKSRFRPLRYDTPERLGDVEFAYREAGHILGSASVELVSPKSRVICSGDLGRPGTPILRDYNTQWRAERPVDLVVMESTYGDGEHRHSHDDIEKELERLVRRAIERKGHILIPAFAIGRTQTVLYHLNTLVEAGRIPAIPVALDSPMGVEITDTYSDFQRLFDREALALIASGDDPLDFRHLYSVRRHSDSVRLSEVPGPVLIIASSGMCTGGRIVGHLQRLLPREETTVLFVGYQARGTTGRAIQEAARSGGRVSIGNEQVRVEAQIETLSGLSAHADRRELARWLSAIPDVKRVALHHGEVEAQRGFEGWWHQRYGVSPLQAASATSR